MSDLQDWSAGPRAPWIVVDSDEYGFVCRRCQTREPFEVPVQLVDWTERAFAFVDRHVRCKGANVGTQEAML